MAFANESQSICELEAKKSTEEEHRRRAQKKSTEEEHRRRAQKKSTEEEQANKPIDEGEAHAEIDKY